MMNLKVQELYFIMEKDYTVEGQIFNQNNELLAKGIATLNAYPFDKSDMKFL